MIRIGLLATLFLTGCAAATPASTQTSLGAKNVLHASASTPKACYHSNRSVDEGDFTSTVSDSNC